ncbi:MAG: hypothetical protein V2B20_04295 [Pseudomonadota bacterium]
MGDRIKNSTLKHLLFWVFLCFMPSMSWASLAVNTTVVSGNIVQHNVDHSVRLDDGKTYFPSRIGLVVNLPAGEAVTLRYFIEGEDKNFFFEYALGLNSLQEIQTPSSKNATNKKEATFSSRKSSSLQLINGVWQN